jgi:hypothetical protein
MLEMATRWDRIEEPYAAPARIEIDKFVRSAELKLRSSFLDEIITRNCLGTRRLHRREVNGIAEETYESNDSDTRAAPDLPHRSSQKRKSRLETQSNQIRMELVWNRVRTQKCHEWILKYSSLCIISWTVTPPLLSVTRQHTHHISSHVHHEACIS